MPMLSFLLVIKLATTQICENVSIAKCALIGEQCGQKAPCMAICLFVNIHVSQVADLVLLGSWGIIGMDTSLEVIHYFQKSYMPYS